MSKQVNVIKKYGITVSGEMINFNEIKRTVNENYLCATVMNALNLKKYIFENECHATRKKEEREM